MNQNFSDTSDLANNISHVTVECIECHTPQHITMTPHQLAELRRDKELIQNILPTHTADEREMFLTGICGKCWDALSPENEDEEGGDVPAF